MVPVWDLAGQKTPHLNVNTSQGPAQVKKQNK